MNQTTKGSRYLTLAIAKKDFITEYDVRVLEGQVFALFDLPNPQRDWGNDLKSEDYWEFVEVLLKKQEGKSQ